MSSKPYFDGPLPRVFAHRGFAAPGGTGAVENTLAAFAAALELGASHLETDVHASRDGVAIVSHDPRLSRLAGLSGSVSDRTLAELRGIALGAGSTFCSLADALEAFPTARFNIDIKSADAVEPTIEAVRAAGAIDRVLVTSFSEARRSAAVAGLPGVATSASARGFALALFAARLGLTPLVRRALRGVDAVQVPIRAAGITVAAPRILRRLHEAGVEVHIWTINDEEVMRGLLDLGVDGIVTDRADLAVKVLESRR